MSRTVLIVEDNDDFRLLAYLVLTRAGYSPVEARNGREGLEYLRSHDPPDLILSDIDMPELSGVELVEELRRDPSLADVPVVFMSCVPGIRGEAARLGVAGFLSKGEMAPAASILAVVRRFCDRPH